MIWPFFHARILAIKQRSHRWTTKGVDVSAKRSLPEFRSVRQRVLESLYQLSHLSIQWRTWQHRHPWMWSLRLMKYVADRGVVCAMAEFGTLLFCQGACRTEKAAGLEYLRLAAKQGCRDAQYQLGLGYSVGNYWLPADPRQAAHWLHLAAEQGHPLAAGRLTELAEVLSDDGKGQGGDKSEKKAVLAHDVA